MLRGIYRIDSYLSSGGFGNTYVGYNTKFEETVAIKEFFMKSPYVINNANFLLIVEN